MADTAATPTATTGAPTAAPVACPNAQIIQDYQTILGRAPDASGLSFWENAAANGTPIQCITAAIQASSEAQAKAPAANQTASVTVSAAPATTTAAPATTTAAPATTTAAPAATCANAQIAQAYQTYLGRAPDTAGLSFWENAAATGTPIECITKAISTSQEAQADAAKAATATVTGPTGSATTAGATAATGTTCGATCQYAKCITGLYENILGRTPDAAGLAFWEKAAASGETICQIAQAFACSQEAKANPATVISTAYQNILGRAPDTAGLAFWEKAAANGTPIACIVNDIKSSPEAGNAAAIANAYKQYYGTCIPDSATLQKYESQLTAGKTICDVQKTFGQDPNAAASITAAITAAYQNNLGRAPDAAGLANWTKQVTSGAATLGQVISQISGSQEAQTYASDPVVQDYEQYLGRAPDAAGLAAWRAAIAAGQSPADVAKEIALSPEGINYASNQVNQLITAQLGADFAKNLTPDQLKQYATIFANPSSPDNTIELSQDQFNATWYLQQNPDVAADPYYSQNPYQHYLDHGFAEGRLGSPNAPSQTADEKLLSIYTAMTQDPTLGPLLKAANPNLYAVATPIKDMGGQWVNRSIAYQYGSYNGLPILSAAVANAILNGSDIAVNFAFGRGNLTTNLGWSSNSASGKILRGAEALGISPPTFTDPQTGLSNQPDYGSMDINQLTSVAEQLGIDPTQFKDQQVQATQPVLDSDGNIQFDQNGNPITNPVYQTDSDGNVITDKNGNPIPVMTTIPAQEGLYKAIDAATQNIYQVTLDTLVPGQAYEGGPNSFQTVTYQQINGKLIPISQPVSHGGMQNPDVYSSSCSPFAGIAFVAGAALAFVTAGASLAGEAALGTTIGTSLGLEGTEAAVAGNAILGASMGALNSAATGKNIGTGALTGGVIGGVTSAMSPLLNTGPMSDVTKSIADASQGVFSQGQVSSIISNTLATTLGTAASGANGQQILKSFEVGLAANGLSQAAVTGISSALQGQFSPDTIAKMAKVAQLVTSTATTSALSGKNEQQVAASLIAQLSNPSSLVKGITSLVGTGGNDSTINPATGQPWTGSDQNATVSPNSTTTDTTTVTPIKTDTTADTNIKGSTTNTTAGSTSTTNDSTTTSTGGTGTGGSGGNIPKLDTADLMRLGIDTSKIPPSSTLQPQTARILDSSGIGTLDINGVSSSAYVLQLPDGSIIKTPSAISNTGDTLLKSGDVIPFDLSSSSNAPVSAITSGTLLPSGTENITYIDTSGGGTTPAQQQTQKTLITNATAQAQTVAGNESAEIPIAVSLVDGLVSNGSTVNDAIIAAANATNLSTAKISAAVKTSTGNGTTGSTGSGTGGTGGTGGGGTGGTGGGGGTGGIDGGGTGGTGGGGTGGGGTGGGSSGSGGGGGTQVPSTLLKKLGPTGAVCVAKTPAKVLKAKLVHGTQIAMPNEVFNIAQSQVPQEVYNPQALPEIQTAATGGHMTINALNLSPELSKGVQIAAPSEMYNVPEEAVPSEAYNPSALQLIQSAKEGGHIGHYAWGGGLGNADGTVSPGSPHLTHGQQVGFTHLVNPLSTSPMPLQMHAAGGEIHTPEFFSEGGLNTLHHRYVTGQGDGTSDSIPAMLANGEFVIPADVVSSLGNGSNDSGANVLNEFLKTIREHKQKHDAKHLPPDSKGPLSYLLEARNKVK